MNQARLYVRSKRSTVITGHVSMESFGSVHTTSDYAEGSTLAKLSEVDEYARNLLRRSGVSFELVDLSKGIGPKLRARLRGIRLTPALVDENKPPGIFFGVNGIVQYVNERANPKEDYPNQTR